MIVPLPDDTPALLDELRNVVAAGEVPLVCDSRWPRAQWEAVTSLAKTAALPANAGWASLTSGSSGTPRIVVRTRESWEASFASVAQLLDAASPKDAVFLPAPAAASMTLFSLAHALGGGPLPARTPIDATCFHGTPHALRTLLETGTPHDLRAALIGGSRLDASVRESAESAGIRVSTYYGAAELSFVAVDTGEGLQPFDGVDIDVRDGELWVRSPFTALGYVGKPGPLRREGAWATVGDRAELDGGTLRLRGRADNAVLTASATVIPEEVEATLRAIAGVRDAVVFALPTSRVGSLVAAFIELEGEPATDLQAACRQHLAVTHRPRAWFAGTLPRTPSGKPARAEAIRRALAGEVSRYES